MSIDTASFTPGLSLTGGLMIGAAAAMLVLFNGRIAGISGILGGLLSGSHKMLGWRIAFLAGLIGAPALANLLGDPIAPDIEAGWVQILLAGFMVGIVHQAQLARFFRLAAFPWVHEQAATGQDTVHVSHPPGDPPVAIGIATRAVTGKYMPRKVLK